MKTSTLKVALVCSKNLMADPVANGKNHAAWVARAAHKSARFIGFPECSLTGYKQAANAARALASREVQAMTNLAIKHNVYIAFGLVEKRGGKFYNTQVLTGPKGMLGAVRKINITNKERKFFTPGSKFPIFDVDGFKLGIMICADATYYEPPMHVLAFRGAQAVFVPHAGYLAERPGAGLTGAWRAGRSLPATAVYSSWGAITPACPKSPEKARKT